MAWPTPTDYYEAIQNPQRCFADPELKTGSPITNLLGLPKPIAGTFANVYQVNCGGRKYAVRCFLRNFPDQEKRYAAISEYLEKVKLPYTVGFKFLKQGIQVKGEWYPILKMEWIEGEPLINYLKKNAANPQVIISLSNKFLKLAADLKQVSIAHGDLQHGNILIQNGEFRLIDYDGMYVPTLTGLLSNELGQPNYQHPSRTEKDFDPKLDNFSEWVIYLSLIVYGFTPNVLNQVNISDDHLLFKRSDYLSPEQSQSLRRLENTSESQVQALCYLFESQIYALDVGLIEAITTSLAPQLALNTAASGSLPNWLEDYVGKSQTGAQTNEAGVKPGLGASWVLDHTGNPEAIRFSANYYAERAALAVAGVSIILLLGIYALGLLHPTLTLFLIVGFSALPLSVSFAGYLSSEQVSAKSKLKAKSKQLISEMHPYQDGIMRLEKQRHQLKEAETRRYAEISRKQSESLRLEKAEIDQIRQKLQLAQDQINSERNKITQAQNMEITSALRTIQEQQRGLLLVKYGIANARIEGIGPELTRRLLAAGIYTAQDVSTGRLANVKGIGVRKGSRLRTWASYTSARIANELPQTLVPTAESAIKSKHRAQLDNLSQRESKANEDSKKEIDAVRPKYLPQRIALAKEQEGITKEFEPQEVEIRMKISEAEKPFAQQKWEHAKIIRELEAYRLINLAEYLRHGLYFGLSGRWLKAVNGTLALSATACIFELGLLPFYSNLNIRIPQLSSAPTIIAAAPTRILMPTSLPVTTKVAQLDVPTTTPTAQHLPTFTPILKVIEPSSVPTHVPTRIISTPAPTSECSDSRAQITAPAMDARLKGTVEIRGTATRSDFLYYKLQFRFDFGNDWGELFKSSDPVANGLLMKWDTSKFEPATYWIRLIVADPSGNYFEPCQVRVVVER